MNNIDNTNIFRGDFYKNPYPIYNYLRENHPVLWYKSDGLPGSWIITRYQDCSEVLTKPHFLRAYDKYNNIPDEHYVYSILKKMFLVNDPPRHTEVRSFFSHHINNITHVEIENMARDITDLIVKNVKNKSEFDAVTDFAFIIPYIFIANLLGFPIEQAEEIRTLSQEMVKGTDKGLTFDKKMDGPNKSAKRLYEITSELIFDREKKPKNDLISAVIKSNKECKLLNHDELVSNIILLLMAGHETTASGISSGVMLLINNALIAGQIKNNPEIMKYAVEEILRLESPVQVTFREPTRDIEIEGIKIKKGDQIAVMMGAANRDGLEFLNPDSFLLDRRKMNHFAFGKGIHYCLGNQVARIEIQVALNSFINSFDNFNNIKIKEFEWNNFFSFRSLKNLIIQQ